MAAITSRSIWCRATARPPPRARRGIGVGPGNARGTPSSGCGSRSTPRGRCVCTYAGRADPASNRRLGDTQMAPAVATPKVYVTYPAMRYHKTLAPEGVEVKGAAQEPGGDGWVDTPAK